MGTEIPPRIWTEGGRPVPPRGVQCVEADCPVLRCSALPLASGARRGGSRPSQGTRFSFSESPELSKREISASSCAVVFLEFFCCLVKSYSAPDAHPAPGLIKAPLASRRGKALSATARRSLRRCRQRGAGDPPRSTRPETATPKLPSGATADFCGVNTLPWLVARRRRDISECALGRDGYGFHTDCPSV